MNMVIYHTMMTTMLTLMIMTTIKMISKKNMIDKQKLSPFECGFNPISYKRLPFSMHFFMIAVIFLVFDIEIIIIAPITMTMKFSNPIMWMITSSLFITIISMGLYYEWMNGMLKWTS